ncbi:MAG: hypothetical protein EOP45_23300 [Sphingobacteriaceae bacterium]|nr:MAG: hypothetical protein EOP45_23300 [Sphingobacteriaceae bacterium]
MDLEQAKVAITLIVPFVKEVVERYISPGIKELVEDKSVSIKMTSHSFENQFSQYLVEYYSKYSIMNIMALSNQKKMLKDMYIPLTVIDESEKLNTYVINNFDENFISVLPDSLTELTNLTYFGLSNNKIETLPDNFGNLKKLHGFAMNNNKLKDLPMSFFSIKSLGDIHLEKNELSIETKNKLKKKCKQIPLYL